MNNTNTPLAARSYFGKDGDVSVEPMVVSMLSSESGWKVPEIPFAITTTKAKEMIKEGYTHVSLANGGNRLDFSLNELTV